MAQVRFYLLEKTPQQQAEYACRLAHKLLQRATATALPLYWYHPDVTQLHILDELLWSFQANQFICHGIEQPDAAINLVSHLSVNPEVLLFNFDSLAIAEPQRIAQIIEIVDAHEQHKVQAREKFKHYRRCQIEPTTFKV